MGCISWVTNPPVCKKCPKWFSFTSRGLWTQTLFQKEQDLVTFEVELNTEKSRRKLRGGDPGLCSA
jgi:hypothetical protein